MNIKYIDIHGHINDEKYNLDRDQVITRAADEGIAMVAVGTDLQSSKMVVQLANRYSNVWAVVGIHPTEKISNPDMVFKELSELARDKRVLAIGECGLDYSMPIVLSDQKSLFEQQIEIANASNKPLMLHIRNGKDNANAYNDALEILKNKAKIKANFHFFAGSLSHLKEIIDSGHSVSFAGVISFTKDYDDLVKSVPIDRIHAETDCPLVAPVPHRGKRNEPSYIIEIVKVIARIRNIDPEELRVQLLDNFQKFFGITI